MDDWGDDDDMMWDDDVGDEFDEDDDGDEEDDPEVVIENMYFEAKDLIAAKETERGAALLREVVASEQTKGAWGFKALKRLCKLLHRQERHDDALAAFKQLLEYTRSAVTLNEAEKALNSLLEHMASSSNISLYFELTLDAFRRGGNAKACVRLELKLARVLFEARKYAELRRTLEQLRRSCQQADGQYDASKSSVLLEILALDMQQCVESGHGGAARLRELYDTALSVRSAIPTPRIVGVINECGGRVRMADRQWAAAHNCFFDAFKNYDESGDVRRIACLRYLVFASMLMQSAIDPFDETRAKSYQMHAGVVGAVKLREAYEACDLRRFTHTLRTDETLAQDRLLQEHSADVVRSLRQRTVVRLLKPYRRVRVEHIAKHIDMEPDEALKLLLAFIVQGGVRALVDQVNGVVICDDGPDDGSRRTEKLTEWLDELEKLSIEVRRHTANQ